MPQRFPDCRGRSLARREVGSSPEVCCEQLPRLDIERCCELREPVRCRGGSAGEHSEQLRAGYRREVRERVETNALGIGGGTNIRRQLFAQVRGFHRLPT